MDSLPLIFVAHSRYFPNPPLPCLFISFSSLFDAWFDACLYDCLSLCLSFFLSLLLAFFISFRCLQNQRVLKRNNLRWAREKKQGSPKCDSKKHPRINLTWYLVLTFSNLISSKFYTSICHSRIHRTSSPCCQVQVKLRHDTLPAVRVIQTTNPSNKQTVYLRVKISPNLSSTSWTKTMTTMEPQEGQGSATLRSASLTTIWCILHLFFFRL